QPLSPAAVAAATPSVLDSDPSREPGADPCRPGVPGTTSRAGGHPTVTPQPAATIGVDLGTTTIKAIAFADDGDGEIAEAKETVGLHTDAEGSAEQDADEVAQTATAVLARVAG